MLKIALDVAWTLFVLWALLSRVSATVQAYIDRDILREEHINGTSMGMVEAAISRERALLFIQLIMVILDVATIFVIDKPAAHPRYPWYSALIVLGLLAMQTVLSFDAINAPNRRHKLLRLTLAPLKPRASLFNCGRWCLYLLARKRDSCEFCRRAWQRIFRRKV